MVRGKFNPVDTVLAELAPPVDKVNLDRIIAGYEKAMLLKAALESGLFDHFDQPAAAPQPDMLIGADRRKKEAFLDALVAMGLLLKEGERYRLSGVASCYLDRRSPHCIRELLLQRLSRCAALENLADKMRADGGEEGDSTMQSGLFTEVMAQSAVSSGSIAGLIRLITRDRAFGRARRLLDLGCSHALYSAALCRLNPNLSATALDRPAVLNRTRSLLQRRGLGERVRLQEIDFYRDPVPPPLPIRGREQGEGYDLALVSHVFYRPVEQVALVLKKLYMALRPGGVLYLQHRLLDATRTAPAQAALFHLTRTMAVPGFYVPTVNEMARGLRRAGFRVTAVYRSRRRADTVIRACRIPRPAR